MAIYLDNSATTFPKPEAVYQADYREQSQVLLELSQALGY